MRNSTSLRKLYWKFAALIVLTVGALLVSPPTKVGAFDCDSNYSNSLSNCLTAAYWYNNNSSPTPQQLYACDSSSYNDNKSCLSDAGYEDACDNIFSSCGYLDGTDVGGCYSTYSSCEFGHMQTHYAMLQCAPSDTSPCKEAASADFSACQSSPADYGCPEGTSDCCLGIERSELANCTSCN